jgi:hypothetical protein
MKVKTPRRLTSLKGTFNGRCVTSVQSVVTFAHQSRFADARRPLVTSAQQRILSPGEPAAPSLTKRYEPVYTRLAVVKLSLRLVTYQPVAPPS